MDISTIIRTFSVDSVTFSEIFEWIVNDIKLFMGHSGIQSCIILVQVVFIQCCEVI